MNEERSEDRFRGKKRKKLCEGLSDRKSQSAPDVLSSGQGAKKTGREEESGLLYSKESLKWELKDLPSCEKSHSVAEATSMNRALPAIAAFGTAYVNIYWVI